MKRFRLCYIIWLTMILLALMGCDIQSPVTSTAPVSTNQLIAQITVPELPPNDTHNLNDTPSLPSNFSQVHFYENLPSGHCLWDKEVTGKAYLENPGIYAIDQN